MYDFKTKVRIGVELLRGIAGDARNRGTDVIKPLLWQTIIPLKEVDKICCIKRKNDHSLKGGRSYAKHYKLRAIHCVLNHSSHSSEFLFIYYWNTQRERLIVF